MYGAPRWQFRLYSFHVRNSMWHPGDSLVYSLGIRNSMGHPGDSLIYFLIERNAMWHPGDSLGHSLNVRNGRWHWSRLPHLPHLPSIRLTPCFHDRKSYEASSWQFGPFLLCQTYYGEHRWVWLIWTFMSKMLDGHCVRNAVGLKNLGNSYHVRNTMEQCLMYIKHVLPKNALSSDLNH